MFNLQLCLLPLPFNITLKMSTMKKDISHNRPRKQPCTMWEALVPLHNSQLQYCSPQFFCRLPSVSFCHHTSDSDHLVAGWCDGIWIGKGLAGDVNLGSEVGERILVPLALYDVALVAVVPHHHLGWVGPLFSSSWHFLVSTTSSSIFFTFSSKKRATKLYLFSKPWIRGSQS